MKNSFTEGCFIPKIIIFAEEIQRSHLLSPFMVGVDWENAEQTEVLLLDYQIYGKENEQTEQRVA